MNLIRLNKLKESLTRPLKPEEVFHIEWFLELTPCRTGACAFGFYFMDHPEENPPGNWEFIEIDYQGLNVPFESIADHFEITTIEMLRIFSPETYRGKVTREMCLERVNTLLNSEL